MLSVSSFPNFLFYLFFRFLFHKVIRVSLFYSHIACIDSSDLRCNSRREILYILRYPTEGRPLINSYNLFVCWRKWSMMAISAMVNPNGLTCTGVSNGTVWCPQHPHFEKRTFWLHIRKVEQRLGRPIHEGPWCYILIVQICLRRGLRVEQALGDPVYHVGEYAWTCV